MFFDSALPKQTKLLDIIYGVDETMIISFLFLSNNFNRVHMQMPKYIQNYRISAKKRAKK